MKVLRHLFLLLFLGVFLLSGVAKLQAQFILYGADGSQGNPSNLYILDKTNGTVLSTIGPIGFAVTGLAIDPNSGTLFGSVANKDPNAPGNLIMIDKTTGQGTVVGDYGFSGQTMADLTFDSSGTLFGWLEASADDLFTINLGTGQATLVGDSTLSTFGSGLAADQSDTLYFAGNGSTNFLRIVDKIDGSVADGPALFFSTVTGTGTVGPGFSGAINALAFDENNTLFGSLNVAGGPSETAPAKDLVTIDTATGEITDLGPTVANLDAIVFEVVPEPSTGGLVLTGLIAGFLFFVLRRKTLRRA